MNLNFILVKFLIMEGRKMIYVGQEKIFIKIIKVKISNGQGYWWVWGGVYVCFICKLIIYYYM